MDAKKKNARGDDFIEDDGDKRVIVSVAIAILVVIGIVIGLLIGCEKEESNTDVDPVNPSIIDGDDEEEEEEQGAGSISAVTKTNTKTDENSENNKEDEKQSFVVTFVYGDKIKEFDVTEGDKVNSYCPVGYTNCKYYYDNDYQYEVDFDRAVDSNMFIYIEGELINYDIHYSASSNNPISYNVLDGVVVLEDATTSRIFIGWYSELEYTNKINTLDENTVLLADENNVIKLYAKIVDTLKVTYHSSDGVVIGDTEEVSSKDIIVKSDLEGACLENTKLLGFTKTLGSNSINYKPGAAGKIDDDTNLYAVCGKAIVVYYNEGEAVETKGYTEEDLTEFELPDDVDLNMEAPTYFVPVEETDENTKVVVGDDKIDILDNEVKLSDVVNSAGTNYNPQTGDNVLEKDKVFDGWTQTDDDVNSPTYGDEIDVPEGFVPTEDETELNAKWKEQDIAEVPIPDGGGDGPINNQEPLPINNLPNEFNESPGGNIQEPLEL